MNYKKKYDSIIENARNSNRKKGDGEVYERHHIIPRSIRPDLIKDPNNIVLLTLKEHFIAHLLLVKIYEEAGDEYNKFKMINALVMMSTRCNGESIAGAREYEKYKKEYFERRSQMQKGKVWTEEEKQKLKGRIPWNKGLHGYKECSEETRKKLSEAAKRHVVTPEEIEKRKATRRANNSYAHSEKTKAYIASLRPYYDPITGQKRMFIPGNQPEDYLTPEEFRKTDLYKPKHWYTNGEINRKFGEDEEIPEGFFLGVVKNEAVNANKTKGMGRHVVRRDQNK